MAIGEAFDRILSEHVRDQLTIPENPLTPPPPLHLLHLITREEMDSTARLISQNKAISWYLLPDTLLNSAPFREIARALVKSLDFRQ